ncbi:hypothetical protein J3E74DRAFT_287586 [Bipolaris maydis]|nr:hypothetical protein J3E74DRAFT_287586 [Bipolaris maydis]
MACVWTCSRVLARDLQTVSMTAFLLAQPWPWPTPLLGFVPARSNQGARNTSRDLLQYNRVLGLLHQGPASSKRIQEVDDAHQSPHPHHGKRAVLAIARCPGNGRHFPPPIKYPYQLGNLASVYTTSNDLAFGKLPH